MADAPAKAVDKTKETTDPAHKEAADKAAVKLKDDATDTKADGTKPATEAKKDGTEHKEPAKADEKTWVERALDEVRTASGSAATWLGIKPVDVSHVPVKKAVESHFVIPPLDYGNIAKTPADKSAVKPEVKPEVKAEVKPENKVEPKQEEKSGFSWLYDKVSNGIEYAAKTVADTAAYGWDAMTSNFDSVSTSFDKLGNIETTRQGTDSDYKITTNHGKLVDFRSFSRDLHTEMNNDEKKVIVRQGENVFRVNQEGDIIASNKKFEVAAEAKDGHRVLTNKETGEKYDYDPKTGEMVATSGDKVARISKDKVESDYKDVTTVINSLVAQGDAIAKKMTNGSIATDGTSGYLLRGNTLIKADKATETISLVTLDASKNPTGLTRVIDTKNGTVTTDNKGVRSEQSLEQFLKENPKQFGWLHRRGNCIDVDATHAGKDLSERQLTVRVNATDNGEPSMVATDVTTGKKVAVDVAPDGKVKQVATDAQGAQIGNTVLVDPANKEHAYKEVNQQGVVTADVDISKRKPVYHINDAQGNNLMTTDTEGNVNYGYGDDAFSLTSEGSIYGAQGQLYHFSSPGTSGSMQGAAVQAEASAHSAKAAASNAASIVASAMSNPGSIDAGYLAGVLGSAYSAASAAMGQSISSFSTSGMLAANSAMSMIESKFGEISRVTGERSNLRTAGLSPDEVNAALKLSLNGNYTPAQSQEWAKKQGNPAA